MNRKKALLAGLLLCSVVYGPSKLEGSGPFFDRAIFTGTYHPVGSIEEFAAGRLGLLQPTYYRKYLVVAFRWLSAKPLTQAEQEGFKAPWQPATGGGLQKWLDARREVIPGEPPKIHVYKRIGLGWQWYLNCGDDGFVTAARTLRERVAAAGSESAGVRSWIKAQDMVFSNCSEGGLYTDQRTSIPPAAEEGLPAVFGKDRQYQIAAATFYAGQFDRAEQMFRDIAADQSSPWNSLAAQLVARCLIRKASLLAGAGQFDRDQLALAAQQLQSVLQNRKMAVVHAPARGLLRYVELRLRPREMLAQLTGKLQDPAGAAEYGRNLEDYLYLMDHVGQWEDLTPDDARRTGELSDWILSIQRNDEVSLAHCYSTWRKTGSTAWLLACLVKVPASNPDAASLLAAGLKVPKGSPGFATGVYHAVRLLLESGKTDRARQILGEAMPALRESLPASDINPFLAQRMPLARNLQEFLLFAPRLTAGITWNDEQVAVPPNTPSRRFLFDTDSCRVFNQGLPLALLLRAAGSTPATTLPQLLRGRLTAAAWVRAVLLSDHEAARAISADLEGCYPELKEELRAYLAANDDEAKGFAAAFLMLRFPGLSPTVKSGIPIREIRWGAGDPLEKYLSGINVFRENWWCALDHGELDLSHFSRGLGDASPSAPHYPSFLTKAERAAVEREWRALVSLGSGPDYLGRVVLNWAGKHPSDPRVAEALHRTVKSVRVGCPGTDSWRYGRRAFQLLHAKYGSTEWAKITKYWYR